MHQGDPLAALLFDIALDPLHRGYQYNPLSSRFPDRFPAPKGYVFQNALTEVTSIGFADDVKVIEGGLGSRSDTDDCWLRLASQLAWTLPEQSSALQSREGGGSVVVPDATTAEDFSVLIWRK